MASPWRCPDCRIWLAPDVTEHRCEGDGGVPAIVVLPDTGPQPLTAVTTPTTTTVTLHVSGSVISQRDLERAIRQAVHRMNVRNPRNP